MTGPRKSKVRLTPELVPKPLWGKSAYRLLGRRAPWKAIRRDTLEAAGHRCSICGGTRGQLSCHERWRYDDKRGRATLAGFEIHCADCDAVSHAGRAIMLGFGDVVIKQLRKVNGCTAEEANRMVATAMLLWKRRSRKKWKVVVAAALLKTHPRLQVLCQST